jgi:hypothetical protein
MEGDPLGGRPCRTSPNSIRGAARKTCSLWSPDYGIWYSEDKAVCLNVLIVEEKKTDLESDVAQALGYMGEYLTMPIILYIRKLTR